MLVDAEYTPHITSDLNDLVRELAAGAGLAVVTEEALHGVDPRPLAQWIGSQPPWSDFPFVVLTRRGGGPERNPQADRLARMLGNVNFIERPFHPTTFVSIVQTALRGRRRQYEARSHLEALNDGAARLRFALTAGRLGSWELELPSMTLHASDACKAIMGLPAENAPTYRDFLAAVHPADRHLVDAAVWRSVSSGADCEIEYRPRPANGGDHWIELRGQVVRDRFGHLVQMAGVLSDVTERKRAAEAAQAIERADSERRFRAIFDSAFQLTWVLDLDGRILVANRTALHSASASNVAGVAIWSSPWWIGSPAESERVKAAFGRAASGEIVNYEVALTFAKDQRQVYDLLLKPVLDSTGGIGLVVVEARDITDQKRTQAALLQSQKMEAIGKLTGGIAHDFNNLLSAVIANLGLLRKRLSGEAQLVRLVDGAMQGAHRGASLTQRLLAFARRQELHAESVDAAELVRSMHDLLDRSVGPVVELRVEAPDRLAGARIDPNQLELAILNLVVNSRDAMPDGGTIVIRLDEVDVDASRDGLEAGRYIRVQVEDNGSGMDAMTLQKAIEPFFSTKEIGKGTGLGLSMVHGLAMQSGGALQLASTPGEGTIASLWLPRDDAPPAPTQRTAEPASDSRPSTILVVDDD
ncbi:MAG TPA: ATP-binding protein, partial [Vineibacter sp.]|nr:ATP-binding protein [Vineibacter sp.]